MRLGMTACTRDRAHPIIATPELAARFRRLTQAMDTTNPEGCWIWPKAVNRAGYGRMLFNYVGLMAHRVAFVLAGNPLDPAMSVCHRCDNPPCVNPAHLFAGTHSENMIDCWSKERRVRPRWTDRPHPRLALPPETRRRVREEFAAGAYVRELAAKYGVRDWVIQRIVYRENGVSGNACARRAEANKGRTLPADPYRLEEET